MSSSLMTRLALAFAFVGGYFDAVSFFLVGTFTGHVTGNSVLAAARIAAFDGRGALACSLAILFFLAGTYLGAALPQMRFGQSERLMLRNTAGFEALLIIAAYFALTCLAAPGRGVYIGAVALAMGLQNGAFRRANSVTVHTTYVSGMFTNVIAGFATALPAGAGDANKSKLPAELRLFAGIFVSFVAGAVTGALLVTRFKELAILGGALLLAAVIFVLSRVDDEA